MTESSIWTSVAAEYAARGTIDDALLAAATAAGVGLVQVGADGTVVWSDEAYRLHGRPRWRRIRSVDDVGAGMSAEDGSRVRSAYWVLTSDPDVQVRYVVRPETGPARELVLHALDLGVAVVHRSGRASREIRPGIVVDVRETVADQVPSQTRGTEPPLPESVAPPTSAPEPRVVERSMEHSVPATAESAPTSTPALGPPARATDPRDDVAAAVLSASPDLVVVYDLDTNRVVLVAGPGSQGPDLIDDLDVGASITALRVHPDDVHAMRDWREGLTSLEVDEVRHTEARFLSSAAWQWRELRATEFLRDEDDVLREVVVVVRDVHERVEAGLRLAERERAFREVFDASPVGLAVLDDQGRFSAVNDAFCRLVGRTREDVFATVYEALLHHEDRAAAVLSRAKKISEGGLATATERRLVRSDGTVMWVRMRTSEIDYDDQSRTLVSVEDVTSSKATEDRLRHDAMHDQLTGLPNRRLIVDRIDRALTRSRRTGTRMALYFIDLDDLKRVNDTHPWQHRAGDVLITSVAVAIRDGLRDTDTLGRLGGDEFVAICEDVGDDATIEDVGARILTAVRRPLMIGSETVSVGASIGVAIPTDDLENAEALLGRADSAMYRAKVSGGSRVVRADFEPPETSGHVDLVAALSRDELRLHYQPIVSLATGALLGVEAVVRWTQPGRGLVPADEVRAAMDSGAGALPVVHWSLTRAIDDVRTVSPTRAQHLLVWLSLPARAALAASTRTAIEEALAGHDGLQDATTAPTLVLGLHERDVASLMRRHTLMRHLSELVTVGPLAVGVVDFSADTVPVGLLRKLETVSVTLDPALLASAADDPAVESLVRSLVGAASALSVVTIAAGVGSQRHLDLARRLGVDAVQGDIVGPLAPLEVYSDLLLSGAAQLPGGRATVASPPARLTAPVAPSEQVEPLHSSPFAPSPFTPTPADSTTGSRAAAVSLSSSAAPTQSLERPVVEPVDERVTEPITTPVTESLTEPVAEPTAEPSPAPFAPQVVAPAVEVPRLLLGGDIGESLARELGLTLGPLDPEPRLPVDANDAPPSLTHEAPETPTGDARPGSSTPGAGPFSGYVLPPSPFLVLRPKPAD